MAQFLSYVFWPRPPQVGYDNPKVQALFALAAFLVAASIVIRLWRRGMRNPVTKKLSKRWGGALFWFGIVAALLTVSRTEDISFIAMRFWWLIWAVALVLFLVVQIRQFRARHYEPLPKMTVHDPRDTYLPKSKKRR